MAEVGYFSIVLALVLSIYGMIAFLMAIRTKNQALLGSAKGATLAVAFLSTVASLILIFFLMSGDYSIKYVYEYTSRDLPGFYRFSAWWAGNSGSLLLWLFLLSWYTVVVAYSRKGKLMAPYASGIFYRIEGKIDVTTATFDGKSNPVVLKFQIYDENSPDKRLIVIYNDVKPDNFQEATGAVVEGKFNKDGTFQADNLNLKCPSKYEQADQSQQEGAVTKFLRSLGLKR